MKKRALFIDLGGTLIVEPPITFQVDNLEQMTFLPAVIRNLYFIQKNLSYKFSKFISYVFNILFTFQTIRKFFQIYPLIQTY